MAIVSGTCVCESGGRGDLADARIAKKQNFEKIIAVSVSKVIRTWWIGEGVCFSVD